MILKQKIFKLFLLTVCFTSLFAMALPPDTGKKTLVSTSSRDSARELSLNVDHSPIKTFLSLEPVVNKKSEYEKKHREKSSVTIELQELYAQIKKSDAKVFSSQQWTRVVVTSSQMLDWLRWKSQKNEISSGLYEKNQNKYLWLILQGLRRSPKEDAFESARRFWLKQNGYDINDVLSLASEAKEILQNRLTDVETLKLYCKLPLTDQEKRRTLVLLDAQKPKASLRSDVCQWLAMRARLGDLEAEKKLIAMFNAAFDNYIDYSDFKGFQNIRHLAKALGYSATDKSLQALVAHLDSPKQYTNSRGSTSVRVAILDALLEAFPEELFPLAYQVQSSATFGLSFGNVNFKNNNFLSYRDEKPIVEFGKFIEKQFGKK